MSIIILSLEGHIPSLTEKIVVCILLDPHKFTNKVYSSSSFGSIYRVDSEQINGELHNFGMKRSYLPCGDIWIQHGKLPTRVGVLMVAEGFAKPVNNFTKLSILNKGYIGSPVASSGYSPIGSIYLKSVQDPGIRVASVPNMYTKKFKGYTKTIGKVNVAYCDNYMNFTCGNPVTVCNDSYSHHMSRWKPAFGDQVMLDASDDPWFHNPPSIVKCITTPSSKKAQELTISVSCMLCIIALFIIIWRSYLIKKLSD